MNKAELRKLYIEKRRSLSPGEIAAMSASIADRFFTAVDLTPVRNLHTFIRIRKLNEIDTSAIYFRVWRDHPLIRTFAPRMAPGDGELESAGFDQTTEFVENRWGIPEPVSEEMADPGEIDLVIVPLLCFDGSGFRVGYGKGFYDRFLQGCREDCLKVGVSAFPPVSSIDGVHENDVPLDICIAPDRNFRFGTVGDLPN